MGKIPFYKSLFAKKTFFEVDESYERIKTKSEFDRLFEQLQGQKGNQNYAYRGCGEAKYKMFTSAQRFWLEKEISEQGRQYADFIERLIFETKDWNNKTIPSYFSLPHLGIGNESDLAFLSFMQHFGMPTPLLDFTSNPLVGLYFAVEPSSYAASDVVIDNYTSLYIVDITEDPEKPTLFQRQREKLDTIVEKQAEGKIGFRLIPEGLLYIDDKTEEFKILNSMNISNQSGSFFFSTSETQPLEEVFKNMTKGQKFAKCVNIHKNLRDYALWKLGSEKITKEYIFPDIHKLTETAISSALVNVPPSHN